MNSLPLSRGALIAAIVAFLIGTIFGLVVLGWWLFPVQWTDASPADLAKSWQDIYVVTVADAYSYNHDINLARQRMDGIPDTEVSAALSAEFQKRNLAGQATQAADLANFATAFGVPISTTGAPAAVPTPGKTGGGNLFSSLAPLLLGLLLLLVVVVAGLMVYQRMSNRAAKAPAGSAPKAAAYDTMPSGAGMTSASTASSAQKTAPPSATAAAKTAAATKAPAPTTKSLGTFAATYKFGDDNYDTAFTLETPKGEFLGECGMGISETIGEGKPDKVTAFDLWLFDKTDVRTVTQILMSEHAFNDQALRSRLAQKGELALAEKGKHILLETATLRVDATIVDMVYASTPGLPANSHFQKLIVEMVPVQK